MKMLASILWRIRSLWEAIIRSTKKTVVRVMQRRDATGCTAGKTGRQTAPAGRMCSYASRRLPFLKYASYTARNGIRHTLPNRKAGAKTDSDF
jgi:hypothetical protein